MAPEKAPAFQFYTKDWDTDVNVIPMSYEEEGVYFAIIRLLWNHKTAPADLDQLRLLLKGQPSLDQMQFWWKKIGKCFTERGGALRQKRVEKDRRKQATRRKTQRLNGLKGGRPKAMGLPTSDPSATHGKALRSASSAAANTPKPPKGGSRKRGKHLRVLPDADSAAVQQAIETQRRRAEMADSGMSQAEIEAVFEREYEARKAKAS